MNFLLHLRQEWEVISKSPFVCLICAIIGFGVGTWYYSEQVATLNNQVNFWKDKATAPGATATATVTTGPAAPTGPNTGSGMPFQPSNAAHFTLNTDDANFFVPQYDDSSTNIVMDVDIRNSGTPSIATGWRLTVTPKGKSPVVAQFMQIPQRLDVGPLTVKESESLANKVAKKRVENGSLVSGRLLFSVHLPLSQVQDDATVFKLSVQDVAGNVFSSEQRAGDWAHTTAN